MQVGPLLKGRSLAMGRGQAWQLHHKARRQGCHSHRAGGATHSVPGAQRFLLALWPNGHTWWELVGEVDCVATDMSCSARQIPSSSSCLWATVVWLSILNIVAYTGQFQTPNLSLHLALLLVTLSLFSQSESVTVL